MTDKQLLKRLEAALKNERLDVVPKGFFTREQWSKKFDCASFKTKKLIRGGIKSGLMERKDFRIKVSGIILPIPHYRVK